MEVVACTASRLSAASLLFDSKDAEWGTGKTDRTGGSSRDVQIVEFILGSLALSRLYRVAAVYLVTVARVGETWPTRTRESGDEDGHEGSKEDSELDEHG